MAQDTYLFTSESVSEGHPDKVADLISDSILDAYLTLDPYAHVACETLVTTGLVVLAGEIDTTSTKAFEVQDVVRAAIKDIGYTQAGIGFDADSCAVLNSLHGQSHDIRQGVKLEQDVGAGDQGIMFGYACDETAEHMPLTIGLSHKILKRLADMRKSGQISWLRPDSKSQVTLEYKNGQPHRIHTVVVSTQHSEKVTQEEIKDTIKNKVLKEVLPSNLLHGDPIFHINPTGRFVTGGPHGDSGVTGRKIIVDTYGGHAPHGGGAFSGKDPTKVDRSAAYAARYIAKNVVAAGLAKRFQVQLAYAIGVAEPVSIKLEDFGTSQVDLNKLEKVVREVFPTKPSAIIKHFDLRRPIFRKTVNYGHFGRTDADFGWEKNDKVADLKSRF